MSRRTSALISLTRHAVRAQTNEPEQLLSKFAHKRHEEFEEKRWREERAGRSGAPGGRGRMPCVTGRQGEDGQQRHHGSSSNLCYRL